jgi:hypothetical protein
VGCNTRVGFIGNLAGEYITDAQAVTLHSPMRNCLLRKSRQKQYFLALLFSRFASEKEPIYPLGVL